MRCSRSDDRGRTFKNVAGDLPDRRDVYSVIQDHINSNLLFAGTEFGLYVSVDGGTHWSQLQGQPPAGFRLRDMAVQKLDWNDLVLGTFGRGFWVLDDYSALREITTFEQSLGEEERLYPLRDVWTYPLKGEAQASEPTWLAPNPVQGAVFTYSVGKTLPTDTEACAHDHQRRGRARCGASISRTGSAVRRDMEDLQADPAGGQGAAAGANGRGSAGAAGFADAAVAADAAAEPGQRLQAAICGAPARWSARR